MSTDKQDAWAPGPALPLLEPGAVHVWRADLATVSEEMDALFCAEELERAGRMLRAGDRVLWMRSRAVLRELLGRYLLRDPRTLRFAAAAHGKPFLLRDAPARASSRAGTPGKGSRLCFNVSHSGDLSLYAITPTCEVGVDVELAGRAIDEPALAARAFGAAEARRLERLDPETREQEFLRSWVRYEAALKCRGTGIGAATREVGCEPWITELELGSRGAGAVAVERPLRELRCWTWLESEMRAPL